MPNILFQKTYLWSARIGSSSLFSTTQSVGYVTWLDVIIYVTDILSIATPGGRDKDQVSD